MKKFLAFLMIVLFLCLVGCADTTDKALAEKNDNDKIVIWTDTETGVQYIIYSYYGYNGGMGGITPRLNADGTLYIEGEQQ